VHALGLAILSARATRTRAASLAPRRRTIRRGGAYACRRRPGQRRQSDAVLRARLGRAARTWWEAHAARLASTRFETLLENARTLGPPRFEADRAGARATPA
jgi:hypothetical protein